MKYLKKIDFFKILSKDFNNQKLIKFILLKTTANIYLSTGYADEKDINFLLKKIKFFRKRVFLIYTDFNKNLIALSISDDINECLKEWMIVGKGTTHSNNDEENRCICNRLITQYYILRNNFNYNHLCL